ncbi:hypothetical protein F2Q68_00002809 [Brassica cretica]|uniref:Uncharacterized protein n=1 Tax=Brassica cretica TaxID=69181 RepID=A0A8S9JG56_BRACR|nr:hypothetical protein F2Q68_00002809 [Brassica cretica]
MVDQLLNIPKEVAVADDGMPESATLSIVDEAENFPSLPHDLDLYAEPTVLELSQIPWTVMEIFLTLWSPNMKEKCKVE